MPRKFTGDDPLDMRNDNALEQFDKATYGDLPKIPDSGRVVAKPTSIFDWRPDLRQPRRAIPVSVRGEWDGDPLQVPGLLASWVEAVEKRIGMLIPIERAVMGDWERLADPGDPEVDALLGLIDLAASIYKEGLINPMRGAKGVIESGERRWLAYHLLDLFSGKDYSKIPTVEKAEVDVWAQAAENGARAPLNAISMARQLALLIMDMYAGDNGVKFDSYATLVLPGECDRRYYAQVANGDLYRIKRGMGDRVLQVTGLKSMDMVRRYRSLLSIPDALWEKADVQDWSEWQIREYVDGANANNPPVTNVHTVTGVTVSADQTIDIPQTQRTRGASGLYVDQPVRPAPPQKPEQPMQPTRAQVKATYDDDYDDVEYTDEEGYEPESAYPPDDEPEMHETTVAEAALWDAKGHKVSATLGMLKSLASDPAVKTKITELMTLSQEDMRVWQMRTPDGWWNEFMNDAIAKLNGLFQEAVIDEMTRYIEHLQQLGRDIRNKHL